MSRWFVCPSDKKNVAKIQHEQTKILKTNFKKLYLLITVLLIFGEHKNFGYAELSKMQKLQVVPDVLDAVPSEVLEVSYPGGKNVDLGNILTPTQVKNMPSVKWNADTTSLYTLCMTDPDAPSRQNPKFREWHHWLVGNIPGNDISKGNTLTEYVGAGPPKNTGLHRYVLALYKQDGKINFDEKKITNRTGNNRGKFSIKKFAGKYNLGTPVAANFFQAEWDSYVPELYKQLGS